MKLQRSLYSFLLFIARLSISFGAAVLFFLVFPATIPSIISFLVFAGGVFLLITARKNDAHKKQLLSDTENTLKEMARQLSHGISSFSSGDMRYHATAPDQTCSTKEAESIAKRLRTSIDDFNSMTATPPKRLCFVGANGYEEGKVAGKHIEKILSGVGSVAYFIPAYNQVNHVLRMKGCRDYLAENSPGIKTAGIFETDGDPENASNIALKAVSDFPDLSLIYITDGHSPGAVAHALAEKNIKIKIVIYDATPTNIDMLKKGMITALIEQNPFAQTWNAFMHLYNACEDSWKPATAKLYMDPIYIDQTNYTVYWDDVLNKRIMREEETAQLVQPVPYHSGKKYRFGVIMPQTDGFFTSLVAGAEAAAKELSPYGVEIEVCNTYNGQTDFGSAKLYNPVIQSFIDRGFNGFITGIIDPNVTFGINKAVDNGLIVTTFSTEPSSFREIILTIVDNAESLVQSSQNLAAAAEESARANIQIGRSISGIREDMGGQKDRIDDTENQLETLTRTQENMKNSLESYTELVSKMSNQSSTGAEEMDETVKETQNIRNAITSIEESLVSFSEKLGAVRNFAGVIEGLAENTNVLAINASIQAARAGNAGKAFAVVAGEIRTLSSDSRLTAENIRMTINDISSSMNNLLKTSAEGSTLMDQNLLKTKTAHKTFMSIMQGLHSSAESIQTIEISAKEIAENGRNVTSNIDAIALGTTNTADRIEEIAVAISELEEQGGHLSQTANNLREMASNQKTTFSQLSVKDTEEEA